jgi:ankyrin repeat protein
MLVLELPPYRRPDNMPELYKKYNDLITAVVMRDQEAVAELLQDGKNPNVRQSDGQTALMIATSMGDTELMKVLLSKGADPNLRGPRGANALTLAQESGRAELIQLLEGAGARP